MADITRRVLTLSGGQLRAKYGDQWERLTLGSAVSTRDPNSVITASSDGASTSVTVAGGNARVDPTAGGTWFWNFNDIQGNPVDIMKSPDLQFLINVSTPPTATSDLWVMIGLTNSLTFAQEAGCGGLHYDAAGGPELYPARQGAGGGAFTINGGAQNASTVASLVLIQVPNNLMRSIADYGLDTTGDWVADRTQAATVRIDPATPLYLFLSFGRSTGAAGAETIEFEAYYKPTTSAAYPS